MLYLNTLSVDEFEISLGSLFQLVCTSISKCVEQFVSCVLED